MQERREYDARNYGQDEMKPVRKGVNAEDAEANHEDLLDRFFRAKVDHPVSKRSTRSPVFRQYLEDLTMEKILTSQSS